MTYNSNKVERLEEIVKPPEKMEKYNNGIKYYKDKVQYLNEGNDYRNFVKNEIK